MNTTFAAPLAVSLRGKHLRVLMNEYYPFLKVHLSKNGTESYSGICWDLINALADQLGFTFELHQAKDGSWGVQTPAGWDGIMGEIYRGEADMGMGLTVTHDRAQANAFSTPFWEEKLAVLLRLESADNSFWFLDPLSATVWAYFLASLVSSSLALWVVTCYQHRNNKWQNLVTSLWYTLGVFLLQGGRMQRSGSWRVIVIFLRWAAIALIGVYAGNLVAYLSTSIMSTPFDTLEEMVAQNKFMYGTDRGIFLMDLFLTATSGVYKDIGDHIRAHNDSCVKDTPTGIRRALHTDYAFIGERSTIAPYTAGYCNVTIMREVFRPGKWCFAVPKNWPYLTEFDTAVLSVLESGLLHRWTSNHWPRRQCGGAGVVAAQHPVTARQFTGLALLLAGGLAAAAAVLMLERGVSLAQAMVTARAKATRLGASI